MPRKIRASKDEETQPPLTQTPGFIIGMTFLGVVAAVIISVLIYTNRTNSIPHEQGGDGEG